MTYKTTLQQQVVVALFIFVLLPFLISCNKQDKEEQPTEVSDVKVYPESVVVTQTGTDVPLNIHATDSNNENVAVDPKSVVWVSSDESIATVDSSGLVSILERGTVVISAIYQEFINTSSIVVEEAAVNIDGLVRYEDSRYNADGFYLPNGNKFKNVRHAIVDLLDISGNILDSTVTTESGRFSFDTIIPNQYSIRILAQVTDSYLSGFRVADMSDRLYAATFPSIENETNYQLDISQTNSVAGAFNLLDVVTASAEFAKQKLGLNPSNLSVYWQRRNNNGTYYCTGTDGFDCELGKGIYVLSVRSSIPSDDDTDEFDDDVIMHEFGHYLLENYAIDDSEGGFHHLTQNDSDLRLAWSEGWGLFIPSAIKSWMQNSKPTLLSADEITTYVDTINSFPQKGRAQISFDIDNPSLAIDPGATIESFYYASSEAAVAKILWNMHEGLNVGMEKIWDVIADEMKLLTTPTNLASFWDGAMSSNLVSPTDLSLMEAIFNDRHVFYNDDVYEPDNTLATATEIVVGEESTNYLYLNDDGLLDEDYFSFVATVGKPYTISTKKLRNGIDTSISIIGDDGNVIVHNGAMLENDDVAGSDYHRFDVGCNCYRVINDGNSLASKLIFTPEASGRYYVKVWYTDKFSAQLDSTGHYGTYTLLVAEL